jgi:hypothetical protein
MVWRGFMGYDPETSEELLPVTPEIVDRWKAQQAKAPDRVDPDSHPFFDPKAGRPNIWHSPGENGALEFFNAPGFHPRTGKALTEITQEFAEELRKRAEELRKRADEEKRKQQKSDEDEERERQEQRRQQQAQQSCDELAANPHDQNRRTGVGVSYEQLRTQTTQAIKACEAAAQNPKDLTSQYQLARAVELVDPRRGQALQDRLVKKGYPAAFDNAGSLLLNDRGCQQHCVNEAVKLFHGSDVACEQFDGVRSRPLASLVGALAARPTTKG